MRFPASVLSRARRVLVIGQLTDSERAELATLTRAPIDAPPADPRWGHLYGASVEATKEVASRLGYDVVIVARPRLPSAAKGLTPQQILQGAVQEILRLGGTMISLDSDMDGSTMQNVKRANVQGSRVVWGSVNPVIGCACARKR